MAALREKHEYPLNQTGNAEQMPVTFDMPRAVTVNRKGEKSVVVRATWNEKGPNDHYAHSPHR